MFPSYRDQSTTKSMFDRAVNTLLKTILKVDGCNIKKTINDAAVISLLTVIIKLTIMNKYEEI